MLTHISATWHVVALRAMACFWRERGPEVSGALQARESALAAARAEAAAASNALKTVETGINYYAARKEYLKLKDIAEASDVAGKVRTLSFIMPYKR